MKSFAFTSILLLTAATAICRTNPAPSQGRRLSDWSGVWQVTDLDKPGGSITLAYDGGSLAGVIVFYVKSRETGERIAIVPRTLVNLHLEGNLLSFQVRDIRKPRLNGDPQAVVEQSDPADIVEMTLTATSQGKAMLSCLKCGEAAPTEVVKQEP